MQDIHKAPHAYPSHYIRTNIIIYHGRVLVPRNQALRQLLILEYHTTLIGGHAGIRRTFHRIANAFIWPELKQQVQDFVNKCHIC